VSLTVVELKRLGGIAKWTMATAGTANVPEAKQQRSMGSRSSLAVIAVSGRLSAIVEHRYGALRTGVVGDMVATGVFGGSVIVPLVGENAPQKRSWPSAATWLEQ
jgi:hypothetical protein